MIRQTIALAMLALAACYPLRNARIIDGSENEKGKMAVWVCVPEEEEALNVGGLECARMDNAMGLSPVKHNPTKPASDAGTTSL